MSSFILTDGLRGQLQRPIEGIVRQMHGRRPGSLPYGASVDLARAILAHAEAGHKAGGGKCWSVVFSEVFQNHHVCPVSSNHFQAIDQTLTWMISSGRLGLRARQHALAATA